jgi:hypothetical protein
MLGRIIGAVVLVIIAITVIISAYRKISPSWERFTAKLASSTPHGEGVSYYAPAASPSPPPAPATSSAAQDYKRPPERQINPAEIPPGFTLADLSPYFKKIRIGSASPAYFGSYEQVTLYAYLDAGERVKVSGWQLKSNRGSQTVPKAVNFYEPSGLSPEEDIYLENGHTLYMYSAVSPVGRNLRLNKCIGYLESFLDFTPPLPQVCPAVDRAEIAGFSGQCQDLILSLGSCRLPPPNPPVPVNDYACRNFLDRLNYGGCVSRYRTDSDFLSKEWRVWYGTGTFLSDRHDRVFLLDSEGKLVDVYSY